MWSFRNHFSAFRRRKHLDKGARVGVHNDKRKKKVVSPNNLLPLKRKVEKSKAHEHATVVLSFSFWFFNFSFPRKINPWVNDFLFSSSSWRKHALNGLNPLNQEELHSIAQNLAIRQKSISYWSRPSKDLFMRVQRLHVCDGQQNCVRSDLNILDDFQQIGTVLLLVRGLEKCINDDFSLSFVKTFWMNRANSQIKELLSNLPMSSTIMISVINSIWKFVVRDTPYFYVSNFWEK